MLQHQVINYKT